MRALLLALSVALAGCSRRAEPPQPFDQTYTTRGIIRALPDQRPGSDLGIQHEQIPEFVNGQGDTVGMRSMTMAFPTLAEGISLEGLEPGDKVRFTFGVRWQQAAGSSVPVASWVVTDIQELPAETELLLGDRPSRG